MAAEDTTPGNGQFIRVSIKDLIDDFKKEIRDGFDRINLRLDNKADRTELTEVRGRVEAVEHRINRFPPEYTDDLLRDFNKVKTDVASLQTNAVTQDALDKRDRGLKTALWALIASIVGTVIAAIIVAALTNHIHL